ncbi:phospholipase A and acyltransferase 4-like isoform 1-T2 [Leptodactylus fuscus]|uniref:phospholipase A and acyltransferase 4-like n=1 Tax=Leptodactylus fuscus TaxID=238119 RepID=UPI003F4EB14E
MPLEGSPPKPGDLIEFIRPLYQHWGVFVGDGKVVHLTDQDGWSSLSSAFGNTAMVREDPIERVADGCIYRVNNKYDARRPPYPPRKIVNAARREVGKKKNYSVTSANCEHFVTELRYGDSFCDQVDNAKTYTVGGLAVAGLAAVALTTWQRSRQKQ